MNIIQSFKLKILAFLERMGYRVSKIPPRSKKTSKVMEMAIAGRTIKIHSGNPLRHVYRVNPAFKQSIEFVAALVEKHFPESWAIDVGANIGDTLTIMKSHSSLPVLCIEGDSHCYELLQENAQQFSNV